MTVKDFIKLDKGTRTFRIVDANISGYMTRPVVLTQADRNVVAREYGEREVVGFESATATAIVIYVK